ncbi:Nitrogen permease regulator 2 [Fragilaria crotonensis]|nr:Nitrogen permease regulator 2 [Fragilaria crotonensis]
MSSDDASIHDSPPFGMSVAMARAFLDQLSSPYLPAPLPPKRCPLLCCFYAEFDNIVGPQIVHQSPPNFMSQLMDVSLDQIHSLLKETFTKGVLDGEPVSTRTTTQTDEESIFGSTCDYIITGNELAGEIINLSTHNMHILARPTVISNERYERNSLLFCVGFVLRRTEDPRPFRPVLSKWADTLLRLEVEDFYLTNHKSQLQAVLMGLLIRLNSGECTLLLHNDSALHLKLYRPLKTVAAPVSDHDVPVLLRKDWQVQMFDWDLAINWVVNNIDGVCHAKALSSKSEVEPEMVRACLRVLRHHNVVALVDMFFYSNRYEPTGKQMDGRFLQEAMDYVCKRRGIDDSEKSLVWGDAPHRGDWKKGKVALAELYNSFDGNETLAGVFCQKVKEATQPDDTKTRRLEWKSILSEIDHRRFVTFGIIHGLIKRVHNYPFAVVLNKRNGTHKDKAYQVASQMNGRTCDDALVSEFERPIGELIQLARSVGSVAELYAT